MTLIIDEMGGGDLIPFREYEYWTGYPAVGWESSKYNHKIEHYIYRHVSGMDRVTAFIKKTQKGGILCVSSQEKPVGFS